MKKFKLVMLLAGVLAIGSAFTTKIHRAPCDDLPKKFRTIGGDFFDFATGGSCNSSPNQSCSWVNADSNPDFETPCDTDGNYVPPQP